MKIGQPRLNSPGQCVLRLDRKSSIHAAFDLVADRGMAPAVGFEPTTNRLTADRSTTELRWIALGDAEHTVASPFVQGKRCFGTKEKLLAQHSSKKLVAGARFEPAIPQTRDYEPSRGRPVI